MILASLYESRGMPWTQQGFLYCPAPNVPFHVISPTLKPCWWDQTCHNDTSAHMLWIKTKRTAVISPTGTGGHWAERWTPVSHRGRAASVVRFTLYSSALHLKLPLYKPQFSVVTRTECAPGDGSYPLAGVLAHWRSICRPTDWSPTPLLMWISRKATVSMRGDRW